MSEQGQLSVSHHQDYQKRAADIWLTLGDFNDLKNWQPAIAESVESVLTGNVKDIGDIRVLSLKDGGTIIEELVAYDPIGMSYTYSIKDSPLPVKKYASTISAEAIPDSSSRVIWSSTFNAHNVDSKQAEDVISGIHQAGFK